MAKKKKAESESEGEGEGKKGKGKMIAMIVVALLVGGFAAKTFFLKPAPLTAKQMQAAKDAAELTLLQTCAAHNHLEIPTKLPEEEAAVPEDAHTLGRGGLRVQAVYNGRTAKEPPATTPEPTIAPVETESGPVIEIEPKTLNLTDGHFLKVGIAVQLPAGALAQEVEETTRVKAVAAKQLIATLSNKSMEDVLSAENRAALEREIGDAVCRLTEAEATTVYFTDFVAQ